MGVKHHTSLKKKPLMRLTGLTNTLTQTMKCERFARVSNVKACWLEDRERGSCRSPDWATGSAVDSALVERECRRDAAGIGRGGHTPLRISVALHQTLSSQAANLSHFHQSQELSNYKRQSEHNNDQAV